MIHKMNSDTGKINDKQKDQTIRACQCYTDLLFIVKINIGNKICDSMNSLTNRKSEANFKLIYLFYMTIGNLLPTKTS